MRAYTGRPLLRTFVGKFKTAALTSPDLFTTDTYKDSPPVPTVLFTNPLDVLPVFPWTEPGGSKDVPTDVEISAVFNRIPLRRVGTTDDLLGAALFFCSRASSFTTGQILTIDGGLTATQ